MVVTPIRIGASAHADLILNVVSIAAILALKYLPEIPVDIKVGEIWDIEAV